MKFATAAWRTRGRDPVEQQSVWRAGSRPVHRKEVCWRRRGIWSFKAARMASWRPIEPPTASNCGTFGRHRNYGPARHLSGGRNPACVRYGGWGGPDGLGNDPFQGKPGFGRILTFAVGPAAFNAPPFGHAEPADAGDHHERVAKGSPRRRTPVQRRVRRLSWRQCRGRSHARSSLRQQGRA